MNKSERILNLLKTGDIDKLSKYNNRGLSTSLLNIIDNEITNFSYDNDIDYFIDLFNLLPDCIKDVNNKSNAYETLKIIHQKMKTHLVQKPGNIEKTNHNYKLLKNMINKVELIQMSILYDYIDRYEGSKYELIDYIIFDLKNISVFNDALNRFPYLVNYFDKNDKKLIVSLCDAYINEVLKYTNDSGIDNIIYYDEVIRNILKSDKIIFDIVDKQTILKKIKDSIKSIKNEKNKKVFYLNSLIEMINTEKEINSNAYLEYKYNINSIFNEAVNSEIRKIVSNYSISKNREIIDDYILTFDGEDAKEIDDALSIKITDDDIILGVHIADPTDIIDEDSIIFDEAAKRTTSIYLSDKTYSMLPSEISTDLISLKQGNYRPAVSYYFSFNKEGILKSYNFKKTIIKVNRNMTYDDFNKIVLLNGNDNLTNTIKNLSKVSVILQGYYHKDPLYQEVNRSQRNITNTNNVGNSNGERVIENSMIFTNHIVSKYFCDNNLPFIFRNHKFNEDVIQRLDKLKKNIIKENNDKAYLGYIEMVKNLYPKALYDVKAKGHAGLGLDTYCHITSPLRRMADIVGLICLNKLYFSEYDEQDIIKINKLVLKHSKNINEKRNSIEKFSKEYELLK